MATVCNGNYRWNQLNQDSLLPVKFVPLTDDPEKKRWKWTSGLDKHEMTKVSLYLQLNV